MGAPLGGPVKTKIVKTRTKKLSSNHLIRKSKELKYTNFHVYRYNLFHKLKMGYVSPMKGIEEENLIERIKEWMKIENYIDKVREDLILYCEDFGPV
jgi:hypothetical protein